MSAVLRPSVAHFGGNGRTFGNPPALEALRELSDLKKRVQENEKSIADLQANSLSYLQHRGRYLDTYRRDVLNDHSCASNIIEANIAVHSANASADCQLFRKGFRKDTKTFESLYSVSVAKIVALKEGGNWSILQIIDDMATRKGNRASTTPDILNCFEQLILLVNEQEESTFNNLHNNSLISELVLRYQALTE
ncbi:hypothetical protein FQN54_006521 [Arachnomyces sp. PD_36]|nr:hypothetical protein FQN54_006521 [Arachnomyces sp. PD_36]